MKTEIKRFILESKEFSKNSYFPIILEFKIGEQLIVLNVIPESGKTNLNVQQFTFIDNSCHFTYSTICNKSEEIIVGTIQLIKPNSPIGNINDGKNSLVFDVSYGETERRGAKLLGIFNLLGEGEEGYEIQNNVKVTLQKENTIEPETEELCEETEVEELIEEEVVEEEVQAVENEDSVLDEKPADSGGKQQK